MDTIKK